MAKNKKKSKKTKIEHCNGIYYNGIIWYYDDPADFVEAYEGFKLWAEVEASK